MMFIVSGFHQAITGKLNAVPANSSNSGIYGNGWCVGLGREGKLFLEVLHGQCPVSISSYLRWEHTGLCSAWNHAIFCILNSWGFLSSHEALGCILHSHSVFWHSQKTESASHVNQKNVLRAKLERMLTAFGRNSHAFNII